MSSVPQRHQHYEGATTSTRRISHNKGFGIAHIGATTGLQHLLSTLQGRCCHRHMQDSLPAGWLAFTGWELNPLFRNERFPSCYISSPFPGFILTLDGGEHGGTISGNGARGEGHARYRSVPAGAWLGATVDGPRCLCGY